jgi:hypothetical protein
MTKTDTDNAVNEASIAAFLAACHARLGFDNRTYLGVTHGESGARWNVYGHFAPPIAFVNESAKTLEEAAQNYRAATDKESMAAKLRAEADRFISDALKLEDAQ